MGSKKSTTTTRHDVPDYIEEGSRAAVNLGSRIANRPYQGYDTNSRFEPLHANERQGVNLAAANIGQPQKYIDKAVTSLDDIKSFPDSDISKYQNPYTQSVLDSQIRDINTAAGKAERAMAPNLSAGSSGDIMARSALQKNLIEGIADTTGKGRAAAFDNAMRAWSGDQDMKMRAADAWSRTAGNVQQMNTQQMRDLMMTGGAARAVAQLNKDFDYQQFMEARDWDVNNLGPLLESLRVPYERSATTTQKNKGGGLGQILGLVGTVVGGYYGGGSGAQMGGQIGGQVGGAV